MITAFARSTKDGKVLLILGLARDDTRRLDNGQAFEVEAHDMGLPDLTIVLAAGESNDSILAQIRASGMITEDTVHEDHTQADAAGSSQTRWWEPRRDGEATPDYLGRVLDELGDPEMARRARLGHFDDYACPPDVDDGANIHRLVAELRALVVANGDSQGRAQAVIDAAKEGEFDGTRAEAQQWMAGPEGQATVRELLTDRRPRP